VTTERDEVMPAINWIKNDPKKYCNFIDGSVFLVALRVRNNKTNTERWEFDVVEFDCDGESACLYYRGKTEIYGSWTWNDFEYFMLLEGSMPTGGEIENE
jgi:hypothetical protein